MPDKGQKKPKNGKNGKNGNGAAAGGSKAKAKGSKKASRGSKRAGGKARFTMDIFNEEAMENAYYTCHNVMDLLLCRGFPWPEAQKKKKKGKK